MCVLGTVLMRACAPLSRAVHFNVVPAHRTIAPHQRNSHSASSRRRRCIPGLCMLSWTQYELRLRLVTKTTRAQSLRLCLLLRRPSIRPKSQMRGCHWAFANEPTSSTTKSCASDFMRLCSSSRQLVGCHMAAPYAVAVHRRLFQVTYILFV